MDDPVPGTSEPQAMQEITEYIDIAETGAPPATCHPPLSHSNSLKICSLLNSLDSTISN